MTKSIKIKELSTYDFIDYLERASPEELDIFAEDPEATLELDPYGLTYKTIRSNSNTVALRFPKKPKDKDYYHDILTGYTYQYNKRERKWEKTLYSVILEFSDWVERNPQLIKKKTT